MISTIKMNCLHLYRPHKNLSSNHSVDIDFSHANNFLVATPPSNFLRKKTRRMRFHNIFSQILFFFFAFAIISFSFLVISS